MGSLLSRVSFLVTVVIFHYAKKAAGWIGCSGGDGAAIPLLIIEPAYNQDGTATDTIVNKNEYDCLDCGRYGIAYWTAPTEQVSVVDRSIQIGPRI